MEREAKIESNFCSFARAHGFHPVKLSTKGWPDRMVVGPHGFLVFIEFKTKHGRLSKHQRAVHGLLISQGFPVWIIKGRSDAETYKLVLKQYMDLGREC